MTPFQTDSKPIWLFQMEIYIFIRVLRCKMNQSLIFRFFSSAFHDIGQNIDTSIGLSYVNIYMQIGTLIKSMHIYFMWLNRQKRAFDMKWKKNIKENQMSIEFYIEPHRAKTNNQLTLKTVMSQLRLLLSNTFHVFLAPIFKGLVKKILFVWIWNKPITHKLPELSSNIHIIYISSSGDM